MIKLSFQTCNFLSVDHGVILEFMNGLVIDHGGTLKLLYALASCLPERFERVF